MEQHRKFINKWVAKKQNEDKLFSALCNIISGAQVASPNLPTVVAQTAMLHVIPTFGLYLNKNNLELKQKSWIWLKNLELSTCIKILKICMKVLSSRFKKIIHNKKTLTTQNLGLDLDEQNSN